VYIDLPNYNPNSLGEFGLAIDTDRAAASGGTQDPWHNGITFTYNSAYNNVDTTPVVSPYVLLPDVVIRGKLFSLAGSGDGSTELRRWVGSDWAGATFNWRGVTTSTIGTHVAFSYQHGVEFSIPFIDLGVPPTTTLHLEFYATGANGVGPGSLSGAWDTVPSDAQASALYTTTVQRRFATFDPLVVEPSVSFAASAYSVKEVDGTAPITLTVAPASTRLISVTLTTTNGTAGPADYVAVSQVFTIAAGLVSRVIPIHIATDALPEPDETVFLALSQPIRAHLTQPMTATLVIHDSPPTSSQSRLYLPILRR